MKERKDLKRMSAVMMKVKSPLKNGGDEKIKLKSSIPAHNTTGSTLDVTRRGKKGTSNTSRGGGGKTPGSGKVVSKVGPLSGDPGNYSNQSVFAPGNPLSPLNYGVETFTKQKKNKSKTIGITDDSINVTVEKKDGSEKDNYITEGDKGYKRKRKRLVKKANRWLNREANRNDDKYSSFRM